MDRMAIHGGEPALKLSKPVGPILDTCVLEAAHECIEEAHFDWSRVSSVAGGGPVGDLETKLTQVLQMKQVLAVSSCTAALHTALIACGVRRGDEVIVPAYTWGQSVGPVLHAGAIPIFADIDESSYTISAETVKPLLTERTKAIIVVDVFGHPADVRAIRSVAKGRGIKIIEDCAQSLGATYRGRPSGSAADIACYSFGRGKAVVGGEGGALATNSPDLYDRAIWFSQHPIRQRYELSGRLRRAIGEFGYNYRIHPIAAAMALAHLDSLAQRVSRSQTFYRRLAAALEGVTGVRSVKVAPECGHSYYLYAPTYGASNFTDGAGACVPRQLFVQALAAEGVPVFEDPISIPLNRRPSLRVLANELGIDIPRSRKGCRVANTRCTKIGIAFAPWLPQLDTDTVPDAIAEACLKVERSFHMSA